MGRKRLRNTRVPTSRLPCKKVKDRNKERVKLITDLNNQNNQNARTTSERDMSRKSIDPDENSIDCRAEMQDKAESLLIGQSTSKLDKTAVSSGGEDMKTMPDISEVD